MDYEEETLWFIILYSLIWWIVPFLNKLAAVHLREKFDTFYMFAFSSIINNATALLFLIFVGVKFYDIFMVSICGEIMLWIFYLSYLLTKKIYRFLYKTFIMDIPLYIGQV
jgi:hypothetical protein